MNNEYLQTLFSEIFNKIVTQNNQNLSELNIDLNNIDFAFEIPKNPEHGDLSTNICLRFAKILKQNPRNLANEIVELLNENSNYNSELIEKIEIAGAGFINVKFSEKYYQNQLQKMSLQGENYGKSFGKNDENKGKSVNVEYVSANPTGLLHLGHGRNAAIGDTLANLYEWTGWKVTREYYFNNAGNQMTNLTKSIFARIMQTKNADFPFPEDGYHGEYVKTIAQELINSGAFNGKLDELFKSPDVLSQSSDVLSRSTDVLSRITDLLSQSSDGFNEK
jgi:arginyl-tRNA synthetase